MSNSATTKPPTEDELREEYERAMQEADAEYDARNWADYRPKYRTSSGDC